jgi:hypothetical protein
MRIITEQQVDTGEVKFSGDVLVIGKGKLYPKSTATIIANNHAHEGIPLLCEYDGKSKTNRKVKRYLPLIETSA